MKSCRRISNTQKTNHQKTTTQPWKQLLQGNTIMCFVTIAFYGLLQYVCLYASTLHWSVRCSRSWFKHVITHACTHAFVSITDSPGAYSSHFHGHQIQTPSASANPAQLSFLQRQRSEASMKEHDSTRHLYHLVMRCFECLSLWRLLCERQFPLVVAGLSKVKGVKHVSVCDVKVLLL